MEVISFENNDLYCVPSNVYDKVKCGIKMMKNEHSCSPSVEFIKVADPNR